MTTTSPQPRAATLVRLRAAEAAMGAGRLDEALAILDGALAERPDDADAWSLRSEVLLRAGRQGEAVEAAERAAMLEFGDARRLVHKARCCCLAGDARGARDAAAAAEAAGVMRANDFALLGAAMARSDAEDEALRLFDRALAIEPGHLEAQRGRAAVLRFLGRDAEAEDACDRVLARNPHDYELQHLRSSLRRQTEARNHVAELIGLVKSGRPDWRGVVQVAYALAKELEDLGKPEAAFHHLKNGASIKRRHTRYDVRDDVAVFDAVIAAFDENALAGRDGQGCPDDAPIFVLGMPRTGSTLVERIITSHSAVASAGELNDFALELVTMAADAAGGRPVERAALASAALALPMETLGERYLAAARGRTGDAPRFVDKLPLNSLYVGYIHLALPNAKIVHVDRNPMDACYAIYKFLFKDAYPFSYDLAELAEYYAGYRRLMDHWRGVLPPGRIIEVRYEDVVADQEAQSRRLIAALGLSWEDACLSFHENRNAATTGSASQVRQAIYTSSVGKWRALERQLQPLADALRARGVPVE